MQGDESGRQMLIDVRDRIGKRLSSKETVDQIKAAKPLADLDARWGQWFVKADFLIDEVYKTRPPAPAGKDERLPDVLTRYREKGPGVLRKHFKDAAEEALGVKLPQVVREISEG